MEVGRKNEKKDTVVMFKQKRWVNPYNDSNTNLIVKFENRLQRIVCKNRRNDFSGKVVDNVGRRKTMVTARTAAQYLKIPF